MIKINKSIHSVVLAFAVLIASSASQASLIIDTINATVNAGIYGGTAGEATLLYDDAGLTGIGIETVDTFGGKSVFEIFGQTFDLSSALTTPVLTFNNGVATEFNFLLSDNNPTDILQAGVNEISFIGSLVFSSSGSKGMFYTGALDVTASAVPVPASIWLFVSGLLGLVGVQRRKG